MMKRIGGFIGDVKLKEKGKFSVINIELKGGTGKLGEMVEFICEEGGFEFKSVMLFEEGFDYENREVKDLTTEGVREAADALRVGEELEARTGDGVSMSVMRRGRAAPNGDGAYIVVVCLTENALKLADNLKGLLADG